MFHSRRWGRPPPGSVGIDWGHPLAKGLLVRLVGGRTPLTAYDQVTGTVASSQTTGGTTLNGHAGGLGYAVKATTGGPYVATWPTNLASQTFTITSLFNVTASNGGFAGIFAYSNGSTAVNMALQLNGSGSMSLFTVGGTVGIAGTWYGAGPIFFAASFNAGAVRVWKNGNLVATGSVSNTTVPSTQRFVMLAERSVTSANSSTGAMESLQYYNRVLSDAEMLALSDNPWAHMRPSRLRTYVMASAPGNTVAVPAGSLVLTGFAPAIVQTANNVIAVPAGTLTLSGQTPTVIASDNKTIAVPAGSLTLTGQTPTVTVSAGNTIAVPLGTLSLSGLTPTVVVSDHQTVAVPLGTLALSGQTPTVLTTQTVAVPAGSLTLTGFAPTVVQTANNVIAVPLATLSLSGFAPTITGGISTPDTPAVVAGGDNKKKQYVEIDGELFRVNSAQEAIALLQQAQEIAEAQIVQVEERREPPPPKPVVIVPPELEADVYVQQINERYEQYQKAYQQMLDDEDDEILMLL